MENDEPKSKIEIALFNEKIILEAKIKTLEAHIEHLKIVLVQESY